MTTENNNEQTEKKAVKKNSGRGRTNGQNTNKKQVTAPAENQGQAADVQQQAKPQHQRPRRPRKQQDAAKATQPEQLKSGSPAQDTAARNMPAKTENKSAQEKAPEKKNEAGIRRNAQQARGARNRKKEKTVRIAFLGGLNEIGKNITVYETDDDIVIVDCGMAFPEDDMPGIDLVIPDFTYLEKNKEKIRGIVLTHGHEDHIGALPYLLKKINVPVYGTRLTLGLVEGKLREHEILDRCSLNVVNAGQMVDFGSIQVEFIHVNHSIPDAVGFGIHTPAGVIVMTGDFKIDTTPIQGEMIDLGRFAELGREGVLALLSDSTNAERPGYTPSERTVGNTFDILFQRAMHNRIIIATFASNIHRVQQIINCAEKFGRKVALSGRSMVNVMTIAMELGYLQVPDGLLIDITQINRYPKEQIVLITTGSQGEPLSALSRMASSDHRQVEVGPGDRIIISANPIPGNEKTVGNVINGLMKLGCEVVYESMYEVHVSGHACQEETKIIMGLTKPKFFLPVHGEQKHLRKNAGIARLMGIDSSRIFIENVGSCVELTQNELHQVADVPAGRILVDGLGVGDVGSIVLRDRKHLAEDGIVTICCTIDSTDGHIVSGPDIVSRGFVYVKESEVLMKEVRELTTQILEQCANQDIRDWTSIKNRMKEAVAKLLFERTMRNPMILPMIMEI